MDVDLRAGASTQIVAGRKGAALRAHARPLATLLMTWVLVSLAVAGVTWGSEGPAEAGPGQPSSDEGVRVDGEALWTRDCASCHGPQGNGTDWGPSLHEKGPAGVALSVETGRMPIERLAPLGERGYVPGELMERRGGPSYRPDEIDDLVEHTRTFLDGPDVEDVETRDANLSRGAELFQAHCAACHSWSGRGAALTSGRTATSLVESTPSQVVQAMRTGIGTMPIFAADALDDEEAAAVAAYVQELREPRSGGGAGLAFRGPFAEGAVAWLVGVVAIVLAVRWIGASG